MKKPKILVIGSTGVLGTKLLKYCYINNIEIYAATCFANEKKLNNLSNKYNIHHTFVLNDEFENNLFLKFLSGTKFDIVYFLDYGSNSLLYLKELLKRNQSTYFAIANKEMIIAGGSFLFDKIEKTNNYFIPLDSEHFSLINNNIHNNFIKKIFITASGGPFYFKKNINLDTVSFKKVIAHPKWKMGINNSVDSSNFINKVLEIFELSSIYKIDLKKIDFLISREAFIHSVIIYKDNTISINSFHSDMIITLVKPLSYFYQINLSYHFKELFDLNKMKLEQFKDKRFKINKYLDTIKSFSHSDQIKFMIYNNKAHKLYLDSLISYNEIIPFIFKKLSHNMISENLNSFDKIISFINKVKNEKN